MYINAPERLLHDNITAALFQMTSRSNERLLHGWLKDKHTLDNVYLSYY